MADITYEDLKAAADENGRTLARTLDIIERTAAKDRGEHADEYAPSTSRGWRNSASTGPVGSKRNKTAPAVRRSG